MRLYLLVVSYLALMYHATMDVDRHVCQEAGHEWHRPWSLRWEACRLKAGRRWYAVESSGAFWGDEDPGNESCLRYRECTVVGQFPPGGYGGFGSATYHGD